MKGVANFKKFFSVLTRRHIRVKVLQTIYAMHQSGSDQLDKEVKFLSASMESLYDLYLIIIDALVEIREKEIEYQTHWHQEDFFCWWEEDDILGQKLVLYTKKTVVAPKNWKFSSRYFTPKKIYQMDQFILSENGKIMRSQTAASIQKKICQRKKLVQESHKNQMQLLKLIKK
jgi:hypothetical protein